MVGCGNCGHKWKPKKDFPNKCPECGTPTSEGLYYIENRKPVGNCMMFWSEGGAGYGCNLDKSGKYTMGQAWSICKGRPELDTMWPVEFIDGLSVRHVDFQSLR